VVADENIPIVSVALEGVAEVRSLPGRSICRDDLLSADVLLVRSVTRVDRSLLEGTPVRYVGTATAGADHVNQADLRELGITFRSAPGCNAQTVVEYVFAVLAATGRDFASKRFGIVGCGQVGGRLYRLLRSLGCEVACFDPFLDTRTIPHLTTLDQVLQADVISLHTPLTRTGQFPTQGMIGADQLAQMPTDALLINAGRGGVIDERALVAHIEKGTGMDLVLDVWESEPLVPEQLFGCCRLMTPHIAGYSELAKLRGAQAIISEIPGVSLKGQSAVPTIARELVVNSWQEAILAVFDPQQATEKLSQLVGTSDGFDQLRKGFGSRLEFSQVGVKLKGDSPSIVGKLGFAIR
jgi:erythronate-4-phosphate dehydrogenase